MHKLPLLPLKDVVGFPGNVISLIVGRDISLEAVEKAALGKAEILLVAQKSSVKENPTSKELYKIGVHGHIIQLLRLNENKGQNIKLMVEVSSIVNLINIDLVDKHFEAEYEILKPILNTNIIKNEARMRALVDSFEEYLRFTRSDYAQIMNELNDTESADEVIYAICNHLKAKVPVKQSFLQELDLFKLMHKLRKRLQSEIYIKKYEASFQRDIDEHVKKKQKEYYLKEQRELINRELGEESDSRAELDEYAKKLKKLDMPDASKEKILSEIKKLKQMGPMSAEASILKNYIETIFDLPWNKQTKLTKNIEQVEGILDEDHYGLDKIKDRIAEYIAVQIHTKKSIGKVLCFVGPPGVGKTSLAKSIARATDREFVRISLGGVRDEAEIRGHRKTYIGAMPGKVIQSMKKVKQSNPVILLDEIDKTGMDHRGDPASALLEVLDPEQNNDFVDNYLEIGYDLSNVMFVATANSYEIPPALYDRMEIIDLTSYSEEEKKAIAKKHLLPKVLHKNGFNSDDVDVTDAAFTEIIRFYTKEAGVRSLERQLDKIIRKMLKEHLNKNISELNLQVVTEKNVKKYLGVRKFSHGTKDEQDLVGVSTGLAYTELGGDILNIESVLTPGKGNLTITGKLGEVMNESAQAAYTFLKSQYEFFQIDKKLFEDFDVHIHVPEGATPKDGPSAGVAIYVSLLSAFTKVKINKDVAMTGEITLTGKVLEIGGLKEKLLGAVRAGIKTVLIPIENQKDLEEIPDSIKKKLFIKPIKKANEALSYLMDMADFDVKWQKSDIEPILNTKKEEISFLTH